MKTYTSKNLKPVFCLLLLLIVLTNGFSQEHNKELKIVFVPSFNRENLVKDKWYLSINKDSIKVTKLKFYVTDFILKDTLKKEYSIKDSNYLIDVFNDKTLINMPLNGINCDLTELSFKIGVKESLNVSGVNSGDLDPSKGMFWSWQSGYINFKIEGVSPSCNTRKNKFQFHIGGYQKPHTTVRTLAFKLNKHKGNQIKINLDVAQLFNEIELKHKNQIMIPGKEATSFADNFSTLFSVNE
jgi:hypothetical protein